MLYKLAPLWLSGLIDGIIVPLTLYAFFIKVQPGAALPITIVGGSVLAVLLGIGAFLTRKAEWENKGSIFKIYENLDISETIKTQMREDAQQELKEWQQEWQETANITYEFSPAHYALNISFSYLTGLAVVVANGLVMDGQMPQFLIMPLILLAVSGYAKFSMAAQNPLVGMITVAGSGVVAVAGNWLVAGLF